MKKIDGSGAGAAEKWHGSATLTTTGEGPAQRGGREETAGEREEGSA